MSEYRFNKDPLFGKYCYIDTPWIAGKKTIYRIISSGVSSNAWVEVPVQGRAKAVTHDHCEDVVFVVLDTLISEDSTIKKFSVKDIVIADTPQTEVSKEEFIEKIKDARLEIKPLTICNITECDYHKYCKKRGQTDCPWK